MPPRQYLPVHELYAEQLLPLSLGFALYEPNPGSGGDEVRIGDIGHVYDGRFKRLASVFEVGNGIPTAIEEQFRGVEQFTDLVEGVLSSKSVRNETFEGSLSGGDPTFGASAGISLKFSCQSEKGATLIRKYRATVEKAAFPITLKRHFTKHFRSVYDFAKSSDRVENLQEIVLVAGRVMTGDWATLTFHNHSQDSSASFDIKAATVTAKGTLWGRWSENVNFPRRHGPLRQQAIADDQEPDFNQCVFIETCRFYDFSWFDRLIATLRIVHKKASPAGIDGIGRLGGRISPSESSPGTYLETGEGGRTLDSDDRLQEMLTAYDVLAFQAFYASESNFNVIRVDEDDIKRLLPTSGTLGSVLETIENLTNISVGSIPEFHKIGRLFHTSDFDGSEDFEVFENVFEGVEDHGLASPIDLQNTSQPMAVDAPPRDLFRRELGPNPPRTRSNSGDLGERLMNASRRSPGNASVHNFATNSKGLSTLRMRDSHRAFVPGGGSDSMSRPHFPESRMQAPTCMGFRVRSVQDAHIIFHAVMTGILPIVQRRLDAEERRALRSGNVYVWEERGPYTEATGLGIERWTDGIRWSASRVRDEFLLYHERDTGVDINYGDIDGYGGMGGSASSQHADMRASNRLVKQTYSVFVNTTQGRRKWHLTAYYTPSSLAQLRTVDDLPQLTGMYPPEGMYTSVKIDKLSSRALPGSDSNVVGMQSLHPRKYDPGAQVLPSPLFASSSRLDLPPSLVIRDEAPDSNLSAVLDYRDATHAQGHNVATSSKRARNPEPCGFCREHRIKCDIDPPFSQGLCRKCHEAKYTRCAPPVRKEPRY